MKAVKFIFLMALIIIGIVACRDKQAGTESYTILSVAEKSSVKQLFFTGTIRPLKAISIPSPVSGVVHEIYFHYGQKVKKGDLLMELHSPKQKISFQKELTEFLKTKFNESTTETKFENDKVLFKEGVISANDFHQSEADYFFSRLALAQAEDSLRSQNDLGELLGVSVQDESNIQRMLDLGRSAQTINVYSTADGVVLFPLGSQSDEGKLEVGKNVSQDEVLVAIGDFNGISVNIKADESSVNNLKIGQSAIVTGSAFPDITLTGSLERIDRQASTGYGSPSFSAKIIIPKLTGEEKEQVHIGMTAQVELLVPEPKQLMVPIKAIVHDERKPDSPFYVRKLDVKNNPQLVPVVTGITLKNDVAITSGLKIGDKILVPNQAD